MMLAELQERAAALGSGTGRPSSAAERALLGAMLGLAARAEKSPALAKLAREQLSSVSLDVKLEIACAAWAAAQCDATRAWLEEHAGVPARPGLKLTLADAHELITKLRA